MSGPLVLGVDEGTTGVKAALFDESLRPVREARRDKVNRHPQPGWVEQDGEEVLGVVVAAIAEVLEDAPGEVVACGLDHQGESVLAWDAETGAPLSPIVVWQDKRSQEVLDRMTDEEEIKRRSGLPFDPYFSAAKLAWLLEHDEDVAKARDEGRLRMGTVDSFLCDRLGAGFATDASTASRTQLHTLGTPGFDPWLCQRFGVPPEVLPEVRDTIGDLGTLSHESWPVELPLRGRVVDQQAALAGAGCVVPGRVKATYGTGVFVLAHVGDEVPTEPPGGLLPTVAWSIDGKMEYALDGGVFAAGAMLEWLCRELGLADEPAALGALARQADGAAGARLLPGLAGLGAPWWRPDAKAVLAGVHGGTTGANVAWAALESIAWRVADIVAAIRETVEVGTLRVDGGLTNEPLMLELQADTIGVPVEAGGADATVAGAAALAAVGAGLLGSLAEAADLLPVDRRVEPQRDDAWRTAEHDRWRAFVAATAALDQL